MIFRHWVQDLSILDLETRLYVKKQPWRRTERSGICKSGQQMKKVICQHVFASTIIGQIIQHDISPNAMTYQQTIEITPLFWIGIRTVAGWDSQRREGVKKKHVCRQVVSTDEPHRNRADRDRNIMSGRTNGLAARNRREGPPDRSLAA